jgi:AmiR/NasT family two-component response regulator
MNPRKRLLIVEDERLVALDLCGTLEELGYAVVGTAASSSEALRVADRERPDLVLIDIRIAGLDDGIHTASILRRQYQLPIAYLTANADAATLERALETEPVEYLVKPYNQQSLRTTIEVAFRRHESELARQQAHDSRRPGSSKRASRQVSSASGWSGKRRSTP